MILVGRASAVDGRGPWLQYEPADSAEDAPHVVLISGDEEYRSEEALPMLGALLAKRHGMRATVLFAIDPDTGEVDPDERSNIPGLAALAEADLMIIATRFRDLPDEQMKHIDDYLQSGRPVIGLRTATHAFAPEQVNAFARYGWQSKEPGWEGGFGRRVLGETWISHHGDHGRQSTRGLVAPQAQDHPIARGLSETVPWGPSDVYTVRLPEGSEPIVLGAVLEGMDENDEPATDKATMPIAWTKSYDVGGKQGRVFTTTMGAATDLESAGVRRMVVNGVYWCLGRADEIPPEGSDVTLDFAYRPTSFGFGTFQKHKRPVDFDPTGELE